MRPAPLFGTRPARPSLLRAVVEASSRRPAGAERGEEGPIRRPFERAPRALLAAGAAVLAALALAAAAAAHSVLIATEPEADAVVEASPERVLLRYDEGVESALGSIRVFDGSGNRVDAETITRPSPEEVAVAIDDELANGTYTVAWRVISADSDPINGAFVFHVGAPGAQPTGIAAQVLEDTSATVSAFYTGGRFLDFLLLLLSAGGVAVLALVLGSAARPLRRRLYGLVAVFAGALVVVALVGIVLQGAAAGGFGLREAFRWEVFSAVADTRYGQASLTRAGLALALLATALGLRRAVGRRETALTVVAAVLAAGMIVTPSFSGHASVAGALALASDIAHVLAAAAWTGGLALVVLALVVAGPDRWPLAARAVPRFSLLAVGSVAVLIVAGSINGYLQVRAWRGLWETTYGLLLLGKIGLVLPLIALGAYNNRYAVPRLRAEIASTIEQRRFLRAAGAELAIMAAIVGVTAVLVNAPPAKSEVDMHAPVAQALQVGDLEAHVSVEPATAGANAVHIMFQEDHAGEAPMFDEVSVSATLPSEEIGPLTYTARPGEHEGEFVVPEANLSIAGEWELRIEARSGEFDLMTGTLSIEIREEP